MKRIALGLALLVAAAWSAAPVAAGSNWNVSVGVLGGAYYSGYGYGATYSYNPYYVPPLYGYSSRVYYNPYYVAPLAPAGVYGSTFGYSAPYYISPGYSSGLSIGYNSRHFGIDLDLPLFGVYSSPVYYSRPVDYATTYGWPYVGIYGRIGPGWHDVDSHRRHSSDRRVPSSLQRRLDETRGLGSRYAGDASRLNARSANSYPLTRSADPIEHYRVLGAADDAAKVITRAPTPPVIGRRLDNLNRAAELSASAFAGTRNTRQRVGRDLLRSAISPDASRIRALTRDAADVLSHVAGPSISRSINPSISRSRSSGARSSHGSAGSPVRSGRSVGRR